MICGKWPAVTAPNCEFPDSVLQAGPKGAGNGWLRKNGSWRPLPSGWKGMTWCGQGIPSSASLPNTADVKGLDMCGAAKMTCCISPTGDVYPCAFLQEPPFLAGNVRNAAFKTMWDRAPVFRELRHLNVETCVTCERFESCRGGCPAMAYHTYQDIGMPDPECLVNLRSDLTRRAANV
jgi:radical SAM protein with 4Fe4S-binding SPASM domain